MDQQKTDPNGKTPIVFYPGRVTDQGYVRVKCTKGHDTITLYDERKHDLLFKSACHALIDGYEREAVSGFAASLERGYEFFIRVAARYHQIPTDEFRKTWKIVAKQSERQFGLFVGFYALITQSSYALNTKMVEFRNKVIHQGYIPNESETDTFGEHVFTQKLALTTVLAKKCAKELGEEIKIEMEEMKNSAPKNLLQLGFKATLVNVDVSTNKASEITQFKDYILGLRENTKK